MNPAEYVAHIDSTLTELRALAVARMRRSCVARPVLGATADPETGADVVEYGEPVYEGPCRFKMGEALAQERDSAGATVTRTAALWHIPYDAPRIPVGAVVFMDGLPPYRTTDVADGDDVTARRYRVEVVTS